MRTQNVPAYRPGGMNASSLGIIAGEGKLPVLLMEACQETGRGIFVLGFEGAADMAAFKDVPHGTVHYGAIGKGIERLKAEGIKDIVLAGKVPRPTVTDLAHDAAARKMAAHMGQALFSGDNVLFKSIVGFLEAEGFAIVGADDVVAELVAPEGVLGKIAPTAPQKSDIALGIKEAHRLGEQDIGQAVIAHNGKIVGVEDAKGTDALIARSHAGVLVKAKKPKQEKRVDLPTIGVKTVENAHKAGLSGIAVEAGGALILDRLHVIERADALNIFVVGVRP